MNENLFSIEAEAEILSAMILLPESLLEGASSGLRVDDFYDPRHRAIFNALLALADRGVEPTFATIADRLTIEGTLEVSGGRTKLYELAEIRASGGRIIEQVAIVADKALRRRLLRICETIAEGARTSEKAEHALEKALALLHDLPNTGASKITPRLQHLLIRQLEIAGRKDVERGRVLSGLETLDAIIPGFRAGDLITVGARPSRGKSSLAFSIAMDVVYRQKRACMIFSLEMGGAELAVRALAASSGVDQQKLRGGGATDAELRRAREASERLANGLLYIEDSATQTITTIRAALHKVVSIQPIDLVIVDYVQLVAAPGIRDRVQEIGYVTRGLKAIARGMGVPVLALAQLNRSAERDERIPRLSDLRESGSIEQDSDIVIFIHRPDEQDVTRAQLVVAKQRNGPTGICSVAFDPECARFRNADYGFRDAGRDDPQARAAGERA